MTYKNYLKAISIYFIIILLTSLINTSLYYFDITNGNITKIIELITLIIAATISGIYIGIKSQNKGYISGLILGSIITMISFIFKIIITRKISLAFFIIYLLLITIITGSSIFGINKKK